MNKQRQRKQKREEKWESDKERQGEEDKRINKRSK
jgi:hypothetical protein